MLKCVVFLFLLQISLSAQAVGLGTRFDLTQKLNLNVSPATGQFAQLFIPDYFMVPTDGKFLLVIHFHSASWAAENEVYRAGINAVLFNIHLGGLSGSYQTFFTDQTKFQKILDTVLSVLDRNSIITNPGIDKIILTSFSAGYGGVREVFKNNSYYGRIDALILADGLHSSSDPASMNTQMKDFLRYAKDARDQNKIFLLTHSGITTPTYQSTTQTSNYLIDSLKTVRIPFSASDEIGTQHSRCDTGNFHLKGYYGTTADDHMKHLYAMHLMVKRAADIISGISSSSDDPGIFPGSYKLYGNYPNPFNPETVIRFAVPETVSVQLEIYTITGEKVITLLDEEKSPGEYNISFNASGLSSGIYIYRLKAGNFSENKKMVLIK